MSSVSAIAKSPAAQELDLDRCAEAVVAAERLLHLAKSGVRKAVEASGSLDASQAAAHGLAWVATYVEALRQMLGWARRLEAEGRLTEMERLITAERLVYHRDRELREANAERERVAAERERLAAEQERLAAEQERLAVERDNALALANALQNLRLFRYTRAPRAVYGFLLRFVRRRRV